MVEEVVKPIPSKEGMEVEIPLRVHADFDIQDLGPGFGQGEEMKGQSGTGDQEERKPRSYYTETKLHLNVREERQREHRRERRAKEMETRARREDEARRYYRKRDERRAEAKRLRTKAAAYRYM